MDTFAQKNQTFEPIRHTFHIVYVTTAAATSNLRNRFQKAKKTSGPGTHKYDESTVRTTDFSPYFFLGKWPLKPLLGIVCSLSGLKGVFITNFSVPSCSKLRRKQRHVWNAHWTMHRGKWTLLILLAAASILQSQTQTNFSSGFSRGFHL